MKIIIAPTQDQTDESHPYNTVTIETVRDGNHIYEVLEFIHSALVAWGFNGDGITKAMNEFEQ